MVPPFEVSVKPGLAQAASKPVAFNASPRSAGYANSDCSTNLEYPYSPILPNKTPDPLISSHAAPSLLELGERLLVGSLKRGYR